MVLGASSLPLAPGVDVQRLGFGTWAWGNKLLWGYEEAADPALEAAFRRVTDGRPLGDGLLFACPTASRRFFFDTGDSYGTGALEGRAETLLGRFRRESRHPRRAVIGTKLAVYPWRLTGESFEQACRASLGRMGEEKIELVQAHWSAVNFQPWQEPALWDGLARCYEAGLADAVGTSNFGPRQLRKANAYWRSRGVPHTANQVQLSLLSTLPLETGLLQECAELGITPIGYSPLALGLLSGNYSPDRLPAGPRSLLFRQILPGLAPLLDCLRAVAAARGKTMSQVAINWSMSQGAVAIVGVRTASQAADNLGALGWALTEAEKDALTEEAKRVPKKATQNIFQTK